MATSQHRVISADVIQLPLVSKPGCPPRIVGFSVGEGRQENESVVTIYNTRDSAWLDIGAGTPDTPPFEFKF